MSDERFHLLFENSLDAIVIADDNGRFLDVNPAACRLFGFTREQMLHMRVGDLTTLHSPGAQEQYQEYLQTGRSTGEFTFIRADKETRVASYSACRLSPGEHLSILRDITERVTLDNRLREERETLETVQRIGLMLTAELDLQKLVQACTDAATELTGAQFGAFFYNVKNERGEFYTLYTISGAPPERFSQFPMPRNTAIFAPTFSGAGTMRMDDVTKDPRYGKNSPYQGQPPGHLPVVSYLAVPVVSRSRAVLGGLFFGHEKAGVFTERTERIVEGIAAQAAIAIDNAYLFQAAQTEIQERTRAEQENAALNARLRRSVQETHHRVKNNLQIISALAELQMEENPEMIPASALKRIGRHARALAAVHDMLTQESRTNVHTDTISAKAALEKLIPLLQTTTGERTIRYEVDEMPLTIREIGSLCLLVNELITNAVKHGRLEVELTLKREGNMARLEVCDDGPGLPPEFDWRKNANIGLGLIDSTGRHDLQGTVSFENRPEGGARVTILFPLLQTHSQP